MRWGEDGWPVFGDGGRTLERWRKPAVSRPQPITRPRTSDEFDERFGHWKGARVGIFCYGRDGHVDVDSVRYVYSDQPGNETVAW